MPEVRRRLNRADYVFGLTGTKALADKLEDVADAIRVERAVQNKDAVRGFVETTHRTGSWGTQRRVAARIEATRLGTFNFVRNTDGTLTVASMTGPQRRGGAAG